MVAQRAELGKNFGVVLIPEGLVEFMHDVSALIAGACARLWPVRRPARVAAGADQPLSCAPPRAPQS